MRPDRIVFKGRKYRLSGNYYRRNHWGSDGPSNLHRAIWEDAHGPIPEGHHIHHADGDTFNNELANLRCVEMSEHLREHSTELQQSGVLKPPSELALRKAAEWHASSEGLDWHRSHGKNTWVGRKRFPIICKQCGKEHLTPYPARTVFCSRGCKDAARKRR